ncbi:MAG: hypothetical protein DWQ47_06460 [Acidobacteria bacterium]|nr:MAG: hypothetical protein DWQ32_10010 [Acidobacteriota bacterium]REK02015.1 MAG: hypothetical protein DWQ38_06440 [Acidobacteriota bacterium]REK14973.1 MAG: hypothetical protein DWQ43_15700 [Acidobacteriota bacterium]REK45687.1 MAG: hypothetical protein DWQ47_06460 [Acidobacteriota bacterium]
MKKIVRSLLIRLGLADLSADREPIDVFVLDDDEVRHRWFEKEFKKDNLEIVSNVEDAKKVLAEKRFDAIFLDHDLLPHHYESNDHDDFGRTGYAVAEWLAENEEVNRSASLIVHTRNADGGLHMVEKLRGSGRQAEYVPFPMLHLKVRSYWKK